MGETRKVSGRGGWKTGHFMLAQERQLNARELTRYESYCEYCATVNCPPAPEHMWFIVNQTLPSV